MKNWLLKLQSWSMKWANTKWSAWSLFICAFADASFLPLPTPLFFITLILLNNANAYKYVLFGTVGSLLGALVGYSIGHFAWLTTNGEFTELAQLIFNNIPGFSETVYNNIQTQFIKWDFWILFVASLIPVPYKIFSISSGVFDINLFMFCLATLISQGIKFYILALLAIRIGPNVKKIIDFKFKHIAIVATICAAIVFIVVKVL